MKKSQEKQLGFNGSITVFFSLIFILLLSIVGAMIQSASIQAAKSIKRAETSLALENLFAEYQVELLNQYDMFAKEGSNKREISERLKFYGVVEAEHEILQSRLLSDFNGQAFYEQAVRSMGGESERIDVLTDSTSESIGESVNEKLDMLVQEEGQELPTENNPIEAAKTLKNTNLLSLIYPSPEQLSNQNVKLESLPSHRVLRKGIGDVEEQLKDSLINHGLFVMYLSEHFSNVLQTSKEHPLFYETEYLLGGYSSDKENLKAVADKIISVRVAMNYAYLLSDETKQAEAEVIALVLSSLMTVPQATEIVKQAILFSWAYGESILDLRVLLKGDKVPLVKTAESWQLQLSNLMRLAAGEEVAGQTHFEEGVTYNDYLKTFLLAEKKETLSMRALDLVELNTGVQVDDCITQLKIKSTCQLRRGITYTFTTNYEYE